MVAHTCNLSTGKPEAGGSQVQSQPELHSEFEASLDFKKQNKTKQYRFPYETFCTYEHNFNFDITSIP